MFVQSLLHPKSTMKYVTMYCLMGFLLTPRREIIHVELGSERWGTCPRSPSEAIQIPQPESEPWIGSWFADLSSLLPAPPTPPHCTGLNHVQYSAHPTFSLSLPHLCTGGSPGKGTKGIGG